MDSDEAVPAEPVRQRADRGPFKKGLAANVNSDAFTLGRNPVHLVEVNSNSPRPLPDPQAPLFRKFRLLLS
jgi:hypothetical protein